MNLITVQEKNSEVFLESRGCKVETPLPDGRKKPIHAENNISRLLGAMISRYCYSAGRKEKY